jgi:hypothetical protein
MPAKLNPTDRKILLIAGGVLLALIVVAIIFAAPVDQEKTPTTYSAASEGAKGAYLLLQQSGYHVDRWEKSPQNLGNGARSVLILAQPGRFATPKEKVGLERFLNSGGTIIATGAIAALALPHNSMQIDPMASSLWERFEALAPSRITRAAPQISLLAAAHWKDDSRATALYGKDSNAVVVRYRHGEGTVFWWASATPLTNAGLKESGNLEFFLASLGDKDSTHILWDEYFHGHGQQTGGPKSHPLLIVLYLQFGLLALAVLFTFSRRSGPIRPLPPEARLSPLEFVETLGGLYQHARAASVAVDVYYQRFHYRLTQRLGLVRDASPGELAKAVRERWNFQDEQFLPILQAASAARYQHDLRAKDALRLVQSLHSYSAKLKLFTANAKEKS